MRLKYQNAGYHMAYWVFVLLLLTVLFGRSWANETAAFYFIAMLLPIVLGASYFFNYFLVPNYYLTKRYFWFALYTFYTLVVSMYLEIIVLMLAFIYLGNFSFHQLNPNASDTLLLTAVLYIVVFAGSFLLLLNQIRDHQTVIRQLLEEKSKEEDPFLEVISNRKMTKIPFRDIKYIESLSDYVRIHTRQDSIVTREKISKLEEVLPGSFLRIHRSFIINTGKITSYTSQEVFMDQIQLNIGRSYKKDVLEALKKE
ncbi:MAG: LytTR family DNA-binding domain-containing protein [Saprospiraceae bacterium]